MVKKKKNLLSKFKCKIIKIYIELNIKHKNLYLNNLSDLNINNYAFFWHFIFKLAKNTKFLDFINYFNYNYKKILKVS